MVNVGEVRWVTGVDTPNRDSRRCSNGGLRVSAASATNAAKAGVVDPGDCLADGSAESAAAPSSKLECGPSSTSSSSSSLLTRE